LKATAVVHYRYTLVFKDPLRPATGMQASVAEGHTGSVLTCDHPDCVAIRKAIALEREKDDARYRERQDARDRQNG
jgi:hypothetical protein